jgi:hypothetical protein
VTGCHPVEGDCEYWADRIRGLVLGLDDDGPVKELAALLNGTVGALL